VYVNSPVVDTGGSSHTTSLTDIFPRQRRIVLVAPGGTGKTTMASYLCYVAARRRAKEIDSPIPFLVLMRDYAPVGGQDKLEHLIVSTIKYRYGLDLSQEALQALLQSGGAFLIIDGLDEVVDSEMRRACLASIAEFSSGYPEVSMLVTTRPYSTFRLDLPQFSYVSIAPWDEELALLYLTKLTTAIGPGKAGWRIHDAIESITDPVATATPLGLQMLSLLWRRGHIPNSFTLLVEEIVNEVVFRREGIRGTSRASPAVLRDMLELVAFTMQSNSRNRAIISANEILKALKSSPEAYSTTVSVGPEGHRFLTEVVSRASILLETGLDPSGQRQFAFSHTAFREYLTSSYLARMPIPDLVAIMETHVSDASWEAVFVGAFELGRKSRGILFFNELIKGVEEHGEASLLLAARSWLEQVVDG
jgi:hypothetical protein